MAVNIHDHSCGGTGNPHRKPSARGRSIVVIVVIGIIDIVFEACFVVFVFELRVYCRDFFRRHYHNVFHSVCIQQGWL
jgi:hypothetical protein